MKMFASLKNKIKEETGSNLSLGKSEAASGLTNLMPHQRAINSNNNSNNNRIYSRSRLSPINSINSNNADNHFHIEQISKLRQECKDLNIEVTALQNNVDLLEKDKSRLEKTNEILLESVKVAQTQKDIYCEEQENIQNQQQSEIEKLRNLLSFREQEAVDRLASLRQYQYQVESLSAEFNRLRPFETELENLKDEFERVRHSMQLDKNNLTTTLAATEEENRHLKKRLQIVEEIRLEALSTLQPNEKLETLILEHKLLKQHLEEAHLQLSDIKSSWSGQNLALEIQVSRLSKQVAEEATEKRKYQQMHSELTEYIKEVKGDFVKANDNIQQRNDKIKLLEEEIDELNSVLKQYRNDSEDGATCERNKNDELLDENNKLRKDIEVTNVKFKQYTLDTGQRIQELEQQLHDFQYLLHQEKEEKLSTLLKNAEISQSEELLRKELRDERDETNELHEKNTQLETELNESRHTLGELKKILHKSEGKLKEIDDLQKDIIEKNKTIKTLNQRLTDLKKTLQKEFCNTKSMDNLSIANDTYKLHHHSRVCSNCGALMDKANDIMDDVNFKYLKHVIVKFLTSREVEARHLIKAVATLLKLSKDEEKLLHDTLNWKMSWFGSKPNHRSGQHAISIPPS